MEELHGGRTIRQISITVHVDPVELDEQLQDDANNVCLAAQVGRYGYFSYVHSSWRSSCRSR